MRRLLPAALAATLLPLAACNGTDGEAYDDPADATAGEPATFEEVVESEDLPVVLDASAAEQAAAEIDASSADEEFERLKQAIEGELSGDQ